VEPATTVVGAVKVIMVDGAAVVVVGGATVVVVVVAVPAATVTEAGEPVMTSLPLVPRLREMTSPATAGLDKVTRMPPLRVAVVPAGVAMNEGVGIAFVPVPL
jgi:hypothetical protein